MVDMKKLKDHLNDDIFSTENEKCLFVVPVVDLSKKKRDERVCYFIAAFGSRPEPRPFVCLLRKSDKSSGQFKRKQDILLTDIEKIDARQGEPQRFDLIGEKMHSFNCDGPKDKNDLMEALYKLCNHYLRNASERPQFLNFTVSDELQALTDAARATDATELVNPTEAEKDRNFEAISSEEEFKLINLMNEWQLSVCDAEKMMERMTHRLADLDMANVSTIMDAEQDAGGLVDKLDTVYNDVVELEEKLTNFQRKLESISSAVRLMSAKDSLIQLERSNRGKMERLLEIVIDSMDITEGELRLINVEDIKSPINQSLISAANKAISVAKFRLPTNMQDCMSGLVSQQQQAIDALRNFTAKSFDRLNYVISTEVKIHRRAMSMQDGHLLDYSACFSVLIPYAPLIEPLKNSNRIMYLKLLHALKREYQPMYECDFKRFLKDNEFNPQVSLGTVMGTKSDRYSIRSSELPPAISDLLSFQRERHMSRVDHATRIDRKLSDIERVILEHMQFLESFLGNGQELVDLDEVANSSLKEMEELEPNAVSDAQASSDTKSSTSTESGGRYHSKTLPGNNEILEDTFSFVTGLLRTTIDNSEKMDNFFCMYAFIRANDRVENIKGIECRFLQGVLARCLVIVKRHMDDLKNECCKAIAKNEVDRFDILRSIYFLSDFIDDMEQLYEETSRRVELDKIYSDLIKSIFASIQSFPPNTGRDTLPADAITNFQIPQNYFELQNVMRQKKVPSLNVLKREAENRFKDSKQRYIKGSYCSSFIFVTTFFDSVERNMNKYGAEKVQHEIGVQVSNLRDVIAELTKHDLRRRVEHIHKKISKQIPQDHSLRCVIWTGVQEYALREYGRYQDLIVRCYAGMKAQLPYTDTEVTDAFRRFC